MTVNTERRNFITSVGVAAASTAVLAGTQALRRRTADVRSADPQTGAVYDVSYPGNPSEIPGFPAATPGDFASPQDAIVLGWNKYRIEVNNDIIKVALNGTDTAQYTILDPATVHFPAPWDQYSGRYPAGEPTFVGLQSSSNYSYTTAFRNIRATVL